MLPHLPLCSLTLTLALPAVAHARVTRIELQSRERLSAAQANAPAYEVRPRLCSC